MLIAGGQSTGGPTNTLEIFSPSANAFASVSAALSSPRQQHAAALLQDGRVLIAGGSNGSVPLSSVDIYDPGSGAVSSAGNMSAARAGLSATTLLDGTVLIAGGNSGNADLASAEIYTPGCGFAATAGRLAAARSGHLAFLLPNNNEVLIAGGMSSGVVLSSAELFVYTPEASASGAFTAAGSMASARTAAAGSALQQDGQLLVAGGTDGTNLLASGEVFGFPTVKTDQSDYPPGTTVIISGSGWAPGETVTLTLVESPLYDTHGPYTAVADTNGNIFNNQFVTDSHDASIRFYLTAAGGSSGLQARNTFTDGNATSVSGTVKDNSGNLISGATITCSSGCNSSYSTTSAADGTYAFSGNNKLSFQGTSGTLTLTASKSGYNSATISLTVNNGGSYPNENFTLTPSSFSTTTTVSASATSPAYGTPVTFTATVVPASGSTAPTGTVQFAIDSVNFGSPVSLTACSPAPHACVTSGSTSTLSAGSHTITATYNPGGSFTVSTGSVPLSVSKAVLTVTASNAGMIYGGSLPAFTASYSGFVNGDTQSVLTGSPTFMPTTAPAGAGTIRLHPRTAHWRRPTIPSHSSMER